MSVAGPPPQPPFVGEAGPSTALCRVVRRLFYGGFALLPWLWFVGWVQFRASARKPDADPRLASLVRSCFVGAVASAVAFAAWVALVRSWPGLGAALALLKAHP